MGCVRVCVRLCFVSCRVGGINRVFIPTCHGIRLRVGANALNHIRIYTIREGRFYGFHIWYILDKCRYRVIRNSRRLIRNICISYNFCVRIYEMNESSLKWNIIQRVLITVFA